MKQSILEYYTDYIKSRNDWDFIDVYTDEGITGTNTKRLEGFKRMVADALDGKIDLIVTKSVSRFARNTVDSLTTIRQLKDKGVECYLQKGFTVDFLTKKQKINEGEVPQYYVENSHEAIINPQAFELVQQELTKRLQANGRYSGVDMFSSKIKCGECGCFFGAKVWHSNSKYRRTIYQCNHKFSTNKKCSTPHFTDDEIKQLFVQAVNQLLVEKKEIIANLELIRKTVFDNSALEIEQKTLQEEMTVLVQVIQNFADENARIAQDQDEYLKRYNGLVKKYELSRLALRRSLKKYRITSHVMKLQNFLLRH